MKKIALIIFFAVSTILLSGQTTQVKWFTIEEAVALTKENPRPIFVDVYTTWCGWCKVFDKETFPNPVIAEMLNTKYYAAKFDGESKDPVTFQGRTFINDGKLGKFHQLAYALLQGKMSFPTVVFLTDKSELITPIPGYRNAAEFEPFLVYFSGSEWQKKSFEDFMKDFKGQVVLAEKTTSR